MFKISSKYLDVVKTIVLIFADDTKEHAVFRSEQDCIEVQDFNSMSEWSEEWGEKKCKSMHMGRSNSKTVSYMKEGDKRVPIKVSEDKDLEVTFCDTIKYDDHILNCVNQK